MLGCRKLPESTSQYCTRMQQSMHVYNTKFRSNYLQSRPQSSGCPIGARKGSYHRSLVCLAADAPVSSTGGSDSATSGSRIRRIRLFRSTDQQERPAPSAADDTGSEPATTSRPLVPVSEEFKKAFESLGGTSSAKVSACFEKTP